MPKPESRANDLKETDLMALVVLNDVPHEVTSKDKLICTTRLDIQCPKCKCRS
jgi:hypothetical protein